MKPKPRPLNEVLKAAVHQLDIAATRWAKLGRAAHSVLGDTPLTRALLREAETLKSHAEQLSLEIRK